MHVIQKVSSSSRFQDQTHSPRLFSLALCNKWYIPQGSVLGPLLFVIFIMISLINVAIMQKFFFLQVMQNCSDMLDQLKILLCCSRIVIDCFSDEVSGC